MRKGWEIRRLGELCDVLDHKRKPITKRDRVAGAYPYYGATGILDHVDGYLFDEPLVLVGEDGAKWESGANTAYAVAGRCWVNNHAHVLRPHRGEVLDNWIIHLLNHTDLTEFVSGLTVPKLTQGSLREIPIPVPPLPDQRRIVGILDEAFAGIAAAKATAERNRDNAHEIFESHLQSVFAQRGQGWLEKPLGELAAFRNGVNYTKDSKGERIRIVGVKDFKNSFWVSLDDLDTVVVDGELSEDDVLRKGDILAVRSNGNPELIGRTILAGEMTGRVAHSGFTIRIRLAGGEVLPQYLCHFMKCGASRKQLTESGTGTNIKSLNQQTLSDLRVPYPPLAAQSKLIARLESLLASTRRLESLYAGKVAGLEELKRSTLHEAFSGGL